MDGYRTGLTIALILITVLTMLLLRTTVRLNRLEKRVEDMESSHHAIVDGLNDHWRFIQDEKEVFRVLRDKLDAIDRRVSALIAEVERDK